MIVSCEAQFWQKKLPKWAVRARLPQIFTEEASKMIVLCEASDNFHKKSFQNDRFVRSFRQFSQKKLPKWSFRARLLQFSRKKLPKWSFRARLPIIFTKKASKMIVSCEASDNFHRKSFQNDRFVRGFQKKLPKRASRARLPQIFTKQFFQNLIVDNPRPMRRTIPRAQNLHFATVSFNRPTESYERVHSLKSKRASRYNSVPSKISKCAFRYTAACTKMYESNARRRRQPAPYKNHHFTTVSNLWPARSDERVARATSKFAFHHTVLDIRSARNDETVARAHSKFAFHHSFGRPTATKWREGCFDDVINLHFTTVLDVRRPRSDERVARDMCKIRISPQFWASDDHEVTRRLSPVGVNQTHAPGVKRRRNFKRSLDPQPFSAATFSSSSQQFSEQLFSAQPFSAALLSSHSQQPLSADLLSSHSQQIFSAANLSSHFQQPFSVIILLWSGVGGQLLSHQVAVVLLW